MKFLSYVLTTLSTLDLHAEKKGKFRTVIKNILFIDQCMNCFIAARGKSKIETTNWRIGQINSNFLNKEFVIFPSKFDWGSIFCDSRR